MTLPPLSTHGGELVLLGVIGGGICILAGISAIKGNAEATAAYVAVLMAIVNAIKERWTSRSIDRMGQQLGASQPTDQSNQGA